MSVRRLLIGAMAVAVAFTDVSWALQEGVPEMPGQLGKESWDHERWPAEQYDSSNWVPPKKAFLNDGKEGWVHFDPAQRGEPVAPPPEEGYLYEETLFGKPYRIWAGPKEGTFVIQYGDESFI